MKKLPVKICTGTLCYVMGGAELQLIDEYLTPEMLEAVDIQGSPCLGYCNCDDSAKAPFAVVGDRIISGANVTKLVEIIKEELNK